MPRLRSREVVKHPLLFPATALGLVLLSMDNSRADLFNATVVADGPLSHVAFADYKDPIAAAEVISPAGDWEWELHASANDADGIPNDISIDIGSHTIAPHPELGEVAPSRPLFHFMHDVKPGDAQDLWIGNIRHVQGPHLDWLQMRIDPIAKGVSRISFRFDHTSSGEPPPPLPPPQPPTAIAIPTLSGAGVVILVLLLVVTATLMLRRHVQVR